MFTVKRGPNKRRIKPAENNDLLQLALCYEDGSEDDDEDFQMGSDDEDEGVNHRTQYFLSAWLLYSADLPSLPYLAGDSRIL
jgi:hypothetical protein